MPVPPRRRFTSFFPNQYFKAIDVIKTKHCNQNNRTSYLTAKVTLFVGHCTHYPRRIVRPITLNIDPIICRVTTELSACYFSNCQPAAGSTGKQCSLCNHNFNQRCRTEIMYRSLPKY